MSASAITDVEQVRSRLTDYGLVYYALLAPVALVLSLVRVLEHGWHPIYVFHIVVVCTAIAAAVLRRHLPYRVRVNLLLGISLSVGVAGLATFGLVGAGPLILVIFAIMSAVALGTRAGLLASALVLCLIVSAAFASHLGLIPTSVDISSYATSISAWGAITATMVMFVPVIVIALGIVQSHLVTSLESLQRSHAKHERLVDNLADAFLYRHTPEGVFNYVSSSVNSVLGYSPGEFLTHFADHMTDHPVNRDATARSQASIQGTQQPRYELQVFHKDRSTRWLEVSETPVFDKNGLVVSVEGVAHDITGRKRAEAELQRLALVIEQTAEIIVITDIRGDIIYVNPAFEKVTGYRRDEAIGENPRILKSGMMDPSVYRELWQTITAGKTWKGRLVNKRKDGTLYTEEATISPMRSSTGELVNFVAVKRDVTRELELEDQLLQAQKMEAVGQLAGGVAHDFNNLLQGIRGFGELALRNVEVGSPAHHSLNEVMAAAERAGSLVGQLLAFSRRQVLVMDDIDLNEAVADVSSMIGRVIGEHIVLDVVPGPSLGTVRADRGQITQILMNLCVNARDAMPAGGRITISTENAVLDRGSCRNHTCELSGRCVLLTVKDTGSGMDGATLERVFEPFFTTKKLGGGTGLGLSTVYGIVKQHNGHVHVSSEVGKGTTFEIYLPEVEGAVATPRAAAEDPVRGGAETILVAEDDDTVRQVSKLILEEAGYTVLTASDGEEAFRVFSRHKADIDLALLDVMMPGTGGRAVFERIRETGTDVRFLFCSGYSMDAIDTNFVLDDGFQLIQKPYRISDLLRKVRTVLDSR